MTRSYRFLVLLGILAFSLPAQNQIITGDTALFALDEVTITAIRIPQTNRQFARLTRIIPQEDIRISPAHDLAGLLEYLPDIDVRQRGPAGVQADVSLRGGTFDQYALLINGINFSDPQTGHFHLDIPIPLNLVERIEVLSGSDVKSLGSNAFSGAINIVTAVPARNSLNAGVSGGRFGYLQAGIDGSLRSGRWWQQAGANYQKSDGYRANTDFNTRNAFYQAGYTTGRFNLSAMAGGLLKAFGANSFYTARYPNQFEKTGTGFGSLTLQKNGIVNIKQSIYYRLHTDEFSLFRSDPPAWYLSPNYHLTQVAGSKTDAWFSSFLGKTGIGLEMRYESILSTVLGEPSSTPKPVWGVDGALYTNSGSRTHYSLSAEQHWMAGRVSINGGVVLHTVRSVRNFMQVYPGLDISYSPLFQLKTFFSLNRAFRLPTFTELYYQSPTNRGNPALLPEMAWHAEAGAEYKVGFLTARGSGFYRYAPQSIDWVRRADETIWHTENLGMINTWGFETGISVRPVKDGSNRLLPEHLDLGFRRYFQEHSAGSYFSQYLLDYLRWKMTAGMTLRLGNPIRLTANLVWQDRNGTYTSFDAEQNMIESDYKPFMVMDLKISWRVKWVVLTAGCTNLFNRSYFDLGSVPQPGAWYLAGLEVNFGGKK